LSEPKVSTGSPLAVQAGAVSAQAALKALIRPRASVAAHVKRVVEQEVTISLWSPLRCACVHAGLHVLFGHHLFGHFDFLRGRGLGLSLVHRLNVSVHRVHASLVAFHLVFLMGDGEAWRLANARAPNTRFEKINLRMLPLLSS
jgi:hypothetical protein